jgi:hypothetical protein
MLTRLPSSLSFLENDCKLSFEHYFYRKGLPSENENKKRLRLQEMKEYEEGKKILSPSIFRKSKGPIMLSASSTALTSTNSLTASLTDASQKVVPSNGFKKPDATAIAKDVSILDYDINQCLDMKDIHCKIFEKRYLCSRVNLQVLRQLS